MKYRTSKVESYDFLAAGSVLYSAPGIPNFPVRLGNEIYNRCLGHYGTGNSIKLYDPCCGGGYLLTTIALLNGKSISHIFASDIDTRTLRWARKNLSLLSKDGLITRKNQMEELFQMYGKDSHQSALTHIDRLMPIVNSEDFDISVECFQSDILNNSASFTSEADIVITDVPYGNLVQWSQESGIDKLLEQLKKNMHKDSIIAIIHDKYQKRTNQDYKRLEKFKVGKRIIEILKIKKSIRMTSKNLVEKWFKCWNTGDYQNIPISESFIHTSPFGSTHGRKAYLDLINKNEDKFLGYSFTIHDAIYEEDKACVRYTGNQGEFSLDVSEWYYIKDNLIDKIYAYYHIGEIREDRKLKTE